jgi:3-isopropylmalate/(R)-2-methylmalate dehydratase small subunit
MLSNIEGRVWLFGDNIDTDLIVKGEYLNVPMEEIKKHVFEPIRPEFAREVMPGDVVVAGQYLGCGSSREVAPGSIKSLGVSAIVAESYGRIFFRNSIAMGLPAVSCPGVGKLFKDKDRIKVDFVHKQITNVTTGETVPFQPLPDEMLKVLEIGGIEPLLRQMAKSHSIGNQSSEMHP